jgi:hypothetical protein
MVGCELGAEAADCVADGAVEETAAGAVAGYVVGAVSGVLLVCGAGGGWCLSSHHFQPSHASTITAESAIALRYCRLSITFLLR